MARNRLSALLVSCTLMIGLTSIQSHADPGEVISQNKISDTSGGFTGQLDNDDRFGHSIARLGDLDGDGFGDIAVGSRWDDDGGTNRGAVWVLFLGPGGTVRSHQKISSTEGGFTGPLDDDDLFGIAVVAPGDIDGDGVVDLAVGAPLDDDGGPDRGAVWILFMNADGTTRSQRKISSLANDFHAALTDDDNFGYSLAALGDLDDNGVPDLAVGAFDDDTGGPAAGAVWILRLDAGARVIGRQKISGGDGNFGGELGAGDRFGKSVDGLGDFNGDGVEDLVVGVYRDDDGGLDRGSVFLIYLATDGNVAGYQKISDTEGSFGGELGDGDNFGSAVAFLGDLDGDGVGDLAVAAYGDDDGGLDQGAVWVLFLRPNGTVRTFVKISETSGGFTGQLDPEDHLGERMRWLDDLDGDGIGDLAVGVPLDDDGGPDRGAVWILHLEGNVSVAVPESGLPGWLRVQPNPFRSSVNLRVDTAAGDPVVARIFDATGRFITAPTPTARSGRIEFLWDGTDAGGTRVRPGVYFIRLSAIGREETRSVILVR